MPFEPALIEIHEDRIRDLESGVSTVKAQLMVQEQRFVYLNEKVGEVDRKVERGVDAILSKLDEHSELLGKLSTRVEDIEDEDDKTAKALAKKKDDRKRFFRGVAIPLTASAILGVVKLIFF